MTDLTIDYTDDWYDGINDCYENDIRSGIIYMYLEAIEDTDHEQRIYYG